MRHTTLQFISLVISSIALLYLLLANIFRQEFIVNDWFVVVIDLAAKTIIEAYILYDQR